MLIRNFIKTGIAIFFVASLLLVVAGCKKDTAVNQNDIVSHQENINATAVQVVGRQQVISLPTGNYTYPVSQALLWAPVTYQNNPGTRKRFPLIFNLYGQSSCGTDITKLIKNKLMSCFIARGFNATAVNPADGKKYEFFVCSPQCPTSWGWSAPHVYNMIAQLKKLYPIDTTRIYLTGCSSGGWGLWSCMTDIDKLTKQFAAIIPISAAAADHPDKLTNVGKYKIACLNICGDQDAFYPDAVAYTKFINSTSPPIKAKLNTLYGVWHNAHCYAYDSAWNTMMGINIYEWMLQYKRQ
jgi:predicted peptidase